MTPHSGTNDNNNIRKIKTIAVIPMAGIIVTTALVSGLVSFMGISYQPAIAQTENATTTTGGVGQFPCAPVQTEGGAGGGGGQNTSTTATTMGGAAATTDVNTTSSTAEEGNQGLGEVAIHI